MKVIIHSKTDDDLILAVRAVKSAKEHGRTRDGLIGIVFEDGSAFSVKWNKSSMTVWCQ